MFSVVCLVSFVFAWFFPGFFLGGSSGFFFGGRTKPSPGLLAPGAHVPHRERGAQPHHGRGARGRGAAESKRQPGGKSPAGNGWFLSATPCNG